MDCMKAAWALNHATHAVKTKMPLEHRIVFIHIGVIPAILLSFGTISWVLCVAFSYSHFKL